MRVLGDGAYDGRALVVLSSLATRAQLGHFHIATLVLNGCSACRNRDFRHENDATVCCNRRGAHLDCHNARGGRAVTPLFFRRIGYHLFESINGRTFSATGQIERSNLTVAPLYRRALGMDE